MVAEAVGETKVTRPGWHAISSCWHSEEHPMRRKPHALDPRSKWVMPVVDCVSEKSKRTCVCACMCACVCACVCL